MVFTVRDCDVVKVISSCEAASVLQGLFDNGTDKTQAAAKAADLLKNMFSGMAFLGRKGDTALKEIENDFSVQKENIKFLLNRNDLFNVWCLGQNKIVSLSLEGLGYLSI